MRGVTETKPHEEHDESEPNTTMDGAHVIVDLLARRKGRKTRPTDMRLAADARHVVAARHALDGDLAARAVLDVVASLPLLEQVVLLRVAVLARAAFVPLGVAVRADADEARWALKNRVALCLAVDLRAIRGRTVMELVWTSLDVCSERGANDGVELVGVEELLSGGERNAVRALCVVSETLQREGLVVYGCVHITHEAGSAPPMPAREGDGM